MLHLLLVAIKTIIYDDDVPPDTATQAPIAMLVMTILIHVHTNLNPHYSSIR